jgi:hypothetical protein
MLWYRSYLLVLFVLWLTFTVLSVDMCYYVMSIAGLMNNDFEIFDRKLLYYNRVRRAKENHDNCHDGQSCFWDRAVGFAFAWNRKMISRVPAHILVTLPPTLSRSISTSLNTNRTCGNK